MRKLALYLLVVLFFNCCNDSDDLPKCVEVTGRSVAFGGFETRYFFILEGRNTEVSKENYLVYRIGAIYCY